MNEYLNVIFYNYANFSGRARRREYWRFMAVHTVVIFISMTPVFLRTFLDSSEISVNKLPFLLTTSLFLIYALGSAVPFLAVSVRRLHDIGIGGQHLWPIFFPSISALILVLALFDSQPGSNKWGPNPKNPDASLVVS